MIALVVATLTFSATAPRWQRGSAAARNARLVVPSMNEDEKAGMPGAPSFEQFKKMMEEQGATNPEKLSVGEKVQSGVSKSWVNPAYWSRQFVQASHISNNVPNSSRVLELGKDAKNLYYLNSPEQCTLIVPPSNANVKEGPIREAAAKLDVPFVLYTEQPLDNIPIRT